MKTKNIICFGFGQVAKNFIKKLNDQEISFKLTTTSREESRNKKFEKISYESFQFTEEGFDKNFISKFEEADHILLSIAPISGTDIVIKNLKDYFPESNNLFERNRLFGQIKCGFASSCKPANSSNFELLKINPLRFGSSCQNHKTAFLLQRRQSQRHPNYALLGLCLPQHNLQAFWQFLHCACLHQSTFRM